MNELLVNFIEQSLKNGELPAQIKKTLILRGTSAEEIDRAFATVNERKGNPGEPQITDSQAVSAEAKPVQVEPTQPAQMLTPQAMPIPPVSPDPSVSEKNISGEKPVSVSTPPSSPSVQVEQKMPKIAVDSPQTKTETTGEEVPVGGGVKEDWGSSGVQKPKVASPIIRVPNSNIKQSQVQTPPILLSKKAQDGGPSGRLQYAEPKKSKKGLLLLFLVIFVPLLVASAGGYYYYFFLVQNPDKVVNRMIEEMQNVSTYHQKMDMSVSFDISTGVTGEGISKLKSKSSSLVSSIILSQLEPEPEENEIIITETEKCVAEDGTKIDCGTPELVAEPVGETSASEFYSGLDPLISIALEGDSDITDKANPKSSYTFTVLVPSLGGELTFEVTTIGSTQYYRLKDIPTDVSSFLPMDLSALENKWIKLDIKSLLEQEELFGIGVNSELSGEIEKIKNEFSSEKITDKVAELQVLLSNSDMIQITEDFGTEEIKGGVLAHHYGFKVDEADIKQFIKSAFAIIYGGIMEDLVTAEELTENLGSINLSGELWIGKKDYLLHKANVKMSTTVKDGELSMTTNYDVLLSLSEFNIPVNIGVPVDYVDFEELLTEILSTIESGSVALSGDESGTQSIASLQKSLDSWYKMYGTYPDTNDVADLIGKLQTAGFIVPGDVLSKSNYGETDKNSFYCYRKAGQHYVLGTILDVQNLSLEADLDGVYLCGATTKDCADPVYCVEP